MSEVAAAAKAVEEAAAAVVAAVARADRLVRDDPGYAQRDQGGMVADFVIGRLRGVLGLTQPPRRNVVSLVEAVTNLGAPLIAAKALDLDGRRFERGEVVEGIDPVVVGRALRRGVIVPEGASA